MPRVATRKTHDMSKVEVPSEIAKVIASIKKRNGDTAVVRGADIPQPFRIPTGIFLYDFATLGGIPHNRMTQFHGPKHSGKTTGALRCIVGAQSSLPDQKAVLVDVEGTYDATWGGKVGVDNDSLIVVPPDTGEQAVDITVGLAHAKETSLIVVDSLAALLPHKEQEASAEDSLVGQQSRLITSMLRKLSAAMITERKRGHFISVLFINQQRSKIGGWSPAGADAISLPGGKATGFFMTLETRFKNKEVLKATDGVDELAWNEHAFTIEKNKMNSGIRAGEFRMLRRADEELGIGEGAIDDAETLLTFAKRNGWWDGTPKKGYDLDFGEFKMHYDSIPAAVRYLYEEPNIYAALRCSLIATHAQSMGMPEPFVNYLLGIEA